MHASLVDEVPDALPDGHNCSAGALVSLLVLFLPPGLLLAEKVGEVLVKLLGLVAVSVYLLNETLHLVVVKVEEEGLHDL